MVFSWYAITIPINAKSLLSALRVTENTFLYKALSIELTIQTSPQILPTGS